MTAYLQAEEGGTSLSNVMSCCSAAGDAGLGILDKPSTILAWRRSRGKWRSCTAAQAPGSPILSSLIGLLFSHQVSPHHDLPKKGSTLEKGQQVAALSRHQAAEEEFPSAPRLAGHFYLQAQGIPAQPGGSEPASNLPISHPDNSPA